MNKDQLSESKNSLSGILGTGTSLTSIFRGISKKEIAKMLQTTPGAIKLFEQAYNDNVLTDPSLNNNAKLAAQENAENDPVVTSKRVQNIVNKITNELLAKTTVLCYDGHALRQKTFAENTDSAITPADLHSIPKELRPQLTGNYLSRQCPGNTAETLLYFYKKYLNAKTDYDKRLSYNMFRQGLDILDLDEITWHILSMNQTAIGNWFPGLINAVQQQTFFQVPKTQIAKVPVPLLQLTRLDYENLTYADRQIANQFCMRAFDLDVTQDYFIKTGTFSSKYDFRNAKVTGESEVLTLGEYLLFIQNQAVMMAGSLSGHPMYGASTTNEWVVREFIQDTENNPCIYMGMPLHTEYRVFADFDTNQILGIVPYWQPDIMKNRFGNSADSDNPHMQHDWIIYTHHEPILMKRYEENKDMIVNRLKAMLPDFNLDGQWSIDIMQNDNEFYIIDMAVAANSALTEFLPPDTIKPAKENWLPKLT